MNDSDINLITSLIDGQLSPAEQQVAFARIETDPDLRAAYDEQLAISSALGSVPAAAMTDAEITQLHATLRTELRLEEAAAAPAAASWWSRRWAPLTGLATAALIVVAAVIVPNLGGVSGDDAGDFLASSAQTSAPSTLASEFRAESAAPEAGKGETQGIAEPSTTAATTESADAAAGMFSLDPTAAEELEELPVLEEEAVNEGLESALMQSRQVASFDPDDIAACFTATDGAVNQISLVGITPDRMSLIGTTIDPITGDEVVRYIDIATCQVTSAD